MHEDAISRLFKILEGPLVGRRAMICILGVAFLARAIVAALFADIDPATAQLWEYGAIAKHSIAHGAIVNDIPLADGSRFVYPTAFMLPLPIFIWMGLFAMLGVSEYALLAMVIITSAAASRLSGS